MPFGADEVYVVVTLVPAGTLVIGIATDPPNPCTFGN